MGRPSSAFLLGVLPGELDGRSSVAQQGRPMWTMAPLEGNGVDPAAPANPQDQRSR
jgi:hypothetical protein